MDFFSQYGRDFNAHNLAQSSYNISRGVGKSMYSGLALQYTKKKTSFLRAHQNLDRQNNAAVCRLL